MNFSMNRLRTLCDQATSAHDMLRLCNDRVRQARHPLRQAQEALVLFDETAHLHKYPTKTYEPEPGKRGRRVEPMGDREAYLKSLVKQLADAQADMQAALAAQAAASERWEPLSSLANRGRAYARKLLGSLPADMETY